MGYFEQHRQAMAKAERQYRQGFWQVILLNLAFWLAVFAGVAYLATHPEQVGHFFGAIAHGFREAR